MPQVVALTRALPDTCEHGHTGVLLCNVSDQLRNDNGLADAGSAVRADLTTPLEWGDQIKYLDTGFQNLCGTGLPVERRCSPVNRPVIAGVDIAKRV